MSEISLVVLIEAGQVRSLAGLAFQLPLPDSLIWGPDVLPRIEAVAQETDEWPTANQLASAMVIDRDGRRLVRAGTSHTFDTPYQCVLFDRMLEAAWGYDVETIPLTSEAIAAAANMPIPLVNSKFSRQMMQEAFGQDEDFNEDELENPFYDGEGEDFRRLNRRTPAAGQGDLIAQQRDNMMREMEDQNWFVSIRGSTDDPFHHYVGDYVLQTFANGGPDVISKLTQLSEVSIPRESQTTRGIVVDAGRKTLNMWAHPRGVVGWDNLDALWSDWTIKYWLTDGYRQQLEATGEAERIVTPSDLQVLSGFVPKLAEQIDLKEMMGQIKSGVRGFVYRGFGCLAILLAIPALIVWAVTGGWKGPFAFAGTLWAIAYIAYLVIATKMKQNFAALAEKRDDAEAMLPKLAPEDKSERIRIVDGALKAAGLPNFEQVEACAEVYDDDEDDESIDPIVSA